MRLQSGGIDVFYIDESHDSRLYAVTAVAIPFLRQVDGQWEIVWPQQLKHALDWRAAIAENLKIPKSKELHGVKLAGGRGNYLVGKRNLTKPQSIHAFREILAHIDMHVPAESVITVVGERGANMYGHERLERVMYALFQRMRTQCAARRVNAMCFFDQGHPEYRSLYRKAQVYLPTGSRMGGWQGGSQKNLPLDMFVKDANEKNSKECQFTQTADLIAFAAFSKVRQEKGMLTDEQREAGLGTLYDAIPDDVLNLRASSRTRDAIVRM